MKDEIGAGGWAEANQRYLVEALAVVRETIELSVGHRHEDARPRKGPRGKRRLEAARREMPGPPALDVVCDAFELSPFERDILLMCAGVELDSSFGELLADVQGDPRMVHPTFSFALATSPDPHWSALSPDRPLRRWRIVEIRPGDRLTSSPLRIDERILNFIVGVDHIDDRLLEFIRPMKLEEELPLSHQIIVDRISNRWSSGNGPSVIQLCGVDRHGKATIASTVCRNLKIPMYLIDASDIPNTSAEKNALAHLWEREARLTNRILFVNCEENEVPRAVISFAGRVSSRLFIASREPVSLDTESMNTEEVERPTAEEQAEVWRVSLGPYIKDPKPITDELVSEFNLSCNRIHSIVVQAADGLQSSNEPITTLKSVCQKQARPRMEGLASRLDLKASWDELVLPESQLRLLTNITNQVRDRIIVYDRWGFRANSSRGLGISALFVGQSGTGKTMAAEVLAKMLNLDLYRIDLSQVVSKYIGETEKNLGQIFDAAEEGGSILLFDEADALFGKRTEIRDSHDRYANIEVSYLLQRMESYQGLAILTTNQREALDPAFQRRIRFIVQFPFPDERNREQIWSNIFPKEVPIKGLDFHQLAKLNVTGGTIFNISIGAAFLAVRSGDPVMMKHILDSARTEYQRLGKSLTQNEIGGFI